MCLYNGNRKENNNVKDRQNTSATFFFHQKDRSNCEANTDNLSLTKGGKWYWLKALKLQNIEESSSF